MKKQKKEEKKVTTIFDAYEIDLEKEVDGIEEQLNYLPGNWVTLARFGNPDCSKMMENLMKPYIGAQRANRKIPDEITDDILNRVLAKTVVKGWRGPAFVARNEETGDVTPLEYSPRNALSLFRIPSLKLLRDEIVVKSKAEDAFKLFQDDEASDNLGE